MKATKASDILLVSDMDGTLINAPAPIGERNLLAIHRFSQMGGHFSVATGRLIDISRRYVEQFDLSAPAILGNGGVIYDFKTDRVLWDLTLPKEARDYMLDLKEKFPQAGIELTIGRQVYNIQPNEFTERRILHENIQYAYDDINAIPDGWYKVLFAAQHEIQLEMIEYIRQNHYDHVYFIPTSGFFLEMLPIGVNKGNGLKKLAEILGIEMENTAAIGDYYNDIDMFKSAGLSAATCEAPDDVKQHADLEMCSSREGAVGMFIDHILNTCIH